MDFIFAKKEETDKGSLLQGDLLIRNDSLKDVLSQAHSYYSDAPDYTHFLVLTQSCDLVRRKTKPKARYITLAAARPVALVVDRFTERHRFNFEFPVVLCEKSREAQARQLLERLIHNTEDGFFFIKRDSHPNLDRDLCVFLALSVAIRAEHYDACLGAKIGQMDHIFAAKVGWLAGNIYSRIGTPDVEEKITNAEIYKEQFYEEILFSRTAWLSSGQFKALKNLVKEWQAQNPGSELDRTTAEDMLEHQLPTDVDLVVERVIQLLTNSQIVKKDDGSTKAMRNTLTSDRYLEKLIRASV